MMHVKYCFVNRVVALWNTLPDEIIAVTYVNSFKNWSQIKVKFD